MPIESKEILSEKLIYRVGCICDYKCNENCVVIVKERMPNQKGLISRSIKRAKIKNYLFYFIGNIFIDKFNISFTRKSYVMSLIFLFVVILIYPQNCF